MALDEIVLPITEPETEWVRGRALQKVSPRRTHARLQVVLAAALDAWAAGRGEVGTEWRFRVPIPGAPLRPLVPDIAFVSHERLTRLSDDELEVPALSPDVAIDILSPSDDPRDVASKIADFLSAGSRLAIVVDGVARSIVLHDSDGSRTLHDGDALEHAALPDFRFELSAYFAQALDRHNSR